MKLDIGNLLFGAAAGFLIFLAGSLMMLTEAFPSGYIRDAYRGGTALYERAFRYRDPYATDLWVKARTEARGVTVLDPERVYDGLTLYTSGHGAQALLIDLHGGVVHLWERPYSTVWQRDRSAVRRPVPDSQIFFRKARLLPGGDLLALYEGVGDSPYGYGMVRLTRDSEVTWTNLANLHHDFDVTPDGRIVTLGHGFRNTPLRGADQFEPPYLEDFLVFLDADGETEFELSLLDAVNDSAYRQFLWRVPYYSMDDPLHANAVDYLDAEKAAWLAQRVPVAAEGQVLVSFRELAGGSLALVDPETGTVVWAARGPWLAQHDPDVLPGGTIQVFDNRGDLVGPGKSRIVEVDPATGGVVWQYGGSEDRPLDSPIRAEQERQPNGNTLITESGGGRLLEVTRDGVVVWEYINPVRGGEDEEMIPVVAWAQRVPYAKLGPAADTAPGRREVLWQDRPQAEEVAL